MAILITSIADATTHFAVTYATDKVDRLPKNSVALKRRGDSFILHGGDDGRLKICKFDQDEITTPSHAEVLATGTVQLTGGASGSVDGITVNGVEVMSGAEAFDTNLDTTATAVAANITANTSVPNYTAAAVTDTITITAVAGSGNTPNDFDVTSTTTTITTTDVDMSGGVSKSDALETALHAILFK